MQYFPGIAAVQGMLWIEAVLFSIENAKETLIDQWMFFLAQLVPTSSFKCEEAHRFCAVSVMLNQISLFVPVSSVFFHSSVFAGVCGLLFVCLFCWYFSRLFS